MKVLVVGKGVVGDATGYALEQRGHQVVYHDPPKGIEGSTEGVEVALLCVPTPRGALGYNSRSAVYKAADWLQQQGYTGLVGIRSTVIPGTCADCQDEFPEMQWFSWPEFLRASLAREMALDPPYQVVGVGPFNPIDDKWEPVAILTDIGDGGERCFVCSPSEAELTKYATNAMLAATVGVANELADWAEALGIDGDTFAQVCKLDRVLPSNVEVSPQGGFGGACLPKDLDALLFHAMRDHGLDMPVLSAVCNENRRRRPDVYTTQCARRDSEGAVKCE